MVKCLISVLCSFFLCVEIFCIKVIPVLKKTFPLENTDAVMFTLTQNVDGSRDFAISLVLDTLKQALFLTVLLVLATFAVLSVIRLLQKRNVLKVHNHLSYKTIVIVLNVVCVAIFAKNIYTDIPVLDYYVAWKDSFSTPQHSEFYQSEYVNPDSVQIGFRKKRNLILIFLESMEYNFQDSLNGGNLPENMIPEITEYLKKEQSFIPGACKLQEWDGRWLMLSRKRVEFL